MNSNLPIIRSLEKLPALNVLDGLAKLHQVVFAADADGNLVWTSDELSNQHDWSVGCAGSECFTDPAELRNIQRRFIRDGSISAVEVEVCTPCGGTSRVEIDGVRLDLPEEERSLFVGIVRPLAEREQRHRDLRDTASFLEGILENSPEGVIAVDRQGFISYANPAVHGILGHTPKQLLDRPVTVLATSPEEIGAISDAFLSKERGEQREVRLRHADGSARVVAISASPLHIRDAGPMGSVALLRDLTEQRRLELALQSKNVELEQYVQNVTHDLRSPLVSLLGFSRLLRQEYGAVLDETGRHFLDRIERAGRNMEGLISDLLELSRIGSGCDRKTWVNVSEVLQQLHAELKPRLESQDVELLLPPDSNVVLCDRTRLYQVFSNLVGNALDYMGPVETAAIHIEVREESEQHRIVVRDNGRGIDPDHRERIFEPFQTVGPRADGRRGTGIGLAIVKKIAQTQGGRVWVESVPGEGAAFHLTLPNA